MGNILFDPIKRELIDSGIKISIILFVAIFLAMLAALTVHAKLIK
ncbi:hypothetical protein [Haliscomenobacter sp.]